MFMSSVLPAPDRPKMPSTSPGRATPETLSTRVRVDFEKLQAGMPHESQRKRSRGTRKGARGWDGGGESNARQVMPPHAKACLHVGSDGLESSLC